MVSENVAIAEQPVAQMQNCKRLSNVDKDASALHQNIASKRGNAYYHAHNREYEIPAHAKIVTGPGLVAGGPPRRLSGPDGAVEDVPVETQACPIENADAETDQHQRLATKDAIPEPIALNTYSWADDGDKVKVYLQCDGFPKDASDNLIKSMFGKNDLRLDIAMTPPRKFKLDRLHKEISPDDCKVRVNAAKGKVTITLSKKRGGHWYQLVDNAQ